MEEIVGQANCPRDEFCGVWRAAVDLGIGGTGTAWRICNRRGRVPARRTGRPRSGRGRECSVDAWGPGRRSQIRRQRGGVFVLFGATGDLAKRMVLPALYRLAAMGCCPGSGCCRQRPGDIAHENFRAQVHDALAESAQPDGGTGTPSRSACPSPAVASAPTPGSLPDVLGEARTSLGGIPSWCTTWPSRRSPSGLTQALGARSPTAPGSSTRSRLAPRPATSANSTGSFIGPG